jgi:hypothetical protein
MSLACLALTVLVCGDVAWGESLELFKASASGADAWVWGTARIKEKDGLLAVTEQNDTDSYGDVFVSDRFPFLAGGEVRLDVAQVVKGDYTFQLLGFKGQENVATVDLIKSATQNGQRAFSLAKAGLPEDVDQIGFKVWVGGGEGATTVLKDLVYVFDLEQTAILLDERMTDKKAWQNESLALTTSPDGRIELGLNPGSTYGSILHLKRLRKDQHLTLLLGLEEVQAGSVSAQLVVFGADGTYQESLDVIQHAQAGWHGMPLDALLAAELSPAFQIKLWVGGTDATRARVSRVMVLKSKS